MAPRSARPSSRRAAVAAQFRVTPLADARFVVVVDGAALGPRWAGWRLTAICRPWRAPGAPAHGPAVAVQAGDRHGWATVETFIAQCETYPSLRLVQAAECGELRQVLLGLEQVEDAAAVTRFIKGARRLLAAAVAAAGGRPPDLSVAEKRAVLAALIRQARRDGTPPERLSLDVAADLLDDACDQGALRTAIGTVRLPPAVSDHALDPDVNRRRRRGRLRQWLRDISLPRWREARTMLAAQTVSS